MASTSYAVKNFLNASYGSDWPNADWYDIKKSIAGHMTSDELVFAIDDCARTILNWTNDKSMNSLLVILKYSSEMNIYSEELKSR